MQVFQTENDIGIALCTLPLHVLFHHHKDMLVLLVEQKKDAGDSGETRDAPDPTHLVS